MPIEKMEVLGEVRWRAETPGGLSKTLKTRAEARAWLKNPVDPMHKRGDDGVLRTLVKTPENPPKMWNPAGFEEPTKCTDPLCGDCNPTPEGPKFAPYTVENVPNFEPRLPQKPRLDFSSIPQRLHEVNFKAKNSQTGRIVQLTFKPNRKPEPGLSRVLYGRLFLNGVPQDHVYRGISLFREIAERIGADVLEEVIRK